jgi:hypothetical protein
MNSKQLEFGLRAADLLCSGEALLSKTRDIARQIEAQVWRVMTTPTLAASHRTGSVEEESRGPPGSGARGNCLV